MNTQILHMLYFVDAFLWAAGREKPNGGKKN